MTTTYIYYYFAKYVRAKNKKIIILIGIKLIYNYLYVILDKANYIIVGFFIYLKYFIISAYQF